MAKAKYWNGTSWQPLDAGDADTLDGKHASEFANATHTHTKSAITNLSTAFYAGVTTNSDNNYSITVSEVSSYVDGLCISFKANANSTGAVTLNVNGLGAKAIKKANGTDITNLKANGIYTVRYNSTTGNFMLQGEGASGNAIASDLLSGKTASTDAGYIVGTMANMGAVNITPSTANQAIPVGYHNGAGVVYGDADLVAGNIKEGINIFGVVGNYTGISTLTAGESIAASNSAERETVGTASYVLNRGGYICQYGGTVRVSFSLRVTNNQVGSVFARIYINGVAVGIERLLSSNNVGYVTYTEDITVQKGDDIQIYCKSSPPAVNAYTKDMQIKIALPFTAVTTGS